MKNLISIAEHSDYLSASTYSDSEKWQLHRKRVGFGKQSLEKWMFVPCDEDGNFLEEPKEKDFYTPLPDRNGRRVWNTHQSKFQSELNKYQQAKERCLFDGFEFISADDDYPFDLIAMEDKISMHCERLNESTIEDLVKYNPELTQTAIKQLEV